MSKNKLKLKKPRTLEATTSILADMTRADMEKLYSVNVGNTEAYFSDRYGWTLRRIKEKETT